jgi:hypothetical protein
MLAQKWPVEFIRLVERGVECADDEGEPLTPTAAYHLTAARFPAFSELPELAGRTGEAERCDTCPDRLLLAHDHANPGPS